MRYPQPSISIQVVLILPDMSDEIVVSDEPDYCEACSGGWGHEVDMTDGFDCRFRCRTCQKELVIHAQHDDWCCDHRYVGEDLWRSEAYYGQHSCPICDGEYGNHGPDCEVFVSEDDEEFDDDEEDNLPD